MGEICDSEICSKLGPSKDHSRLCFVCWLLAALLELSSVRMPLASEGMEGARLESEHC